MSLQQLNEAARVVKQRSERGLKYERFVKQYHEWRGSREEKPRELIRKLDESARKLRGVRPEDVHENKFLTDLSIKYANDDFIGDRLLIPVPVDKRSDTIAIYDEREQLAYPDDSLSLRSSANEIDRNKGKGNYSVEDRGLKDCVPAEDIDNQDAPFDEMFDSVETLLNGIAFNREKRIAAIMTKPESFAGNAKQLSGSSKWSHESGGNPIKDLQDAVASLWNSSGNTKVVAYSSLEVYNTLARNKAILGLFKITEGLATPQQIAHFFGIDEYLVGKARKDTKNEGQAPVYGRMWGNVFGVARVATRPSRRIAAFGFTFRLREDPVVTSWFELDSGKRGGYWNRVAVSEDHKIVAPRAGYLLYDVI